MRIITIVTLVYLPATFVSVSSVYLSHCPPDYSGSFLVNNADIL